MVNMFLRFRAKVKRDTVRVTIISVVYESSVARKPRNQLEIYMLRVFICAEIKSHIEI